MIPAHVAATRSNENQAKRDIFSLIRAAIILISRIAVANKERLLPRLHAAHFLSLVRHTPCSHPGRLPTHRRLCEMYPWFCDISMSLSSSRTKARPAVHTSHHLRVLAS
ncbi:unnamed protein product [Cercospora beticola]|nr:unnamed protein product [Cercospora beticola]